MEKKLKIAVIGLGNRGRIYSSQLQKNPNVEIVCICEKNPSLLKAARVKLGLAASAAYLSDSEFFKAGKLADALVIATQDRDHYYHAKTALNLGYHLLLEKPVSPNKEEMQELADLSEQKGLKVVVCHVLRYAPYYDGIKKALQSGVIGEIVSINNTENVGYWHFSHSYVRGNWRNEAEAAPSILAKCCHDLDLIYYFTGKKCKEVYSTGTRALFLPQNAPQGATDYCLAPCPHKKDCPFYVPKLYYKITKYSIPKLIGKATLITKQGKFSLRELKEALKTSPYGRCVYKCDNDVMENQIVALKLEGGINVTHTMTAFSKDCYRKIHISGTKGEIIGADEDGYFRVNIFGGKSYKVKTAAGILVGHLGGDQRIITDFVDFMLNGKLTPKITLIAETLESHYVAYAAEQSRKSGAVIKL